jgi:hypothetical protein
MPKWTFSYDDEGIPPPWWRTLLGVVALGAATAGVLELAALIVRALT